MCDVGPSIAEVAWKARTRKRIGTFGTLDTIAGGFSFVVMLCYSRRGHQEAACVHLEPCLALVLDRLGDPFAILEVGLELLRQGLQQGEQSGEERHQHHAIAKRRTHTSGHGTASPAALGTATVRV